MGNVRVVLTDEYKKDQYPMATMEQSNAGVENSYYSKIEETRKLISEVPGYPTDGTTSPNQYTARLNSGDGHKIGPGILLKVMAGDKIELRCNSFWKDNSIQPNNQSPIAEILLQMASAVPGVSGGHFTAGQAGTGGSFFTIPVTAFVQDNNPVQTNKPKAYINWLMLNEQLEYKQGNGSGAEFVGAGNTLQPFTRLEQNGNAIPVPQSGYVYIYTSNESNIDVFFDNLQVNHVRGPLVEETHYYPFGLTMAGISSKAAGSLINRNKFNDGSELENKEFSDGSGLEWYTTDFRKYDAQIGRFTQVDPLCEINTEKSGYVFASNNPINYNDPTGLLDSVGINKNGETIYHNEGDELQNVIVTPASYAENNTHRVNWLSYSIFGGGYGGKTGRQIQNETNTQIWRKDHGLPYLPYGDTAYYNRAWQAEQDWRTMSYGATGALVSPLIFALSFELVTAALPEIATFVQDKSLQLWFESSIRLNGLKSEFAYGLSGLLGSKLTPLQRQQLQKWGDSFSDPVKFFKDAKQWYDRIKDVQKLSK